MNERTQNRIGTRFEKILVEVEKQLLSELAKARAETDHSATIGARAEAEVRRALRQFLPTGFGVGHGKVYDAFGDGTAQTDLIVTTADHPFTFPVDEPGWYVIDGVAAVGEVKAVLTTGELDDSLKKASRFKRLRPSYHESDMITSVAHRERARETAGLPPFIVIAFENRIASNTLFDRLAQAPLVPVPEGKGFTDQQGNDPQPPIDAVCLLGEGILLNVRATTPLSLLQADSADLSSATPYTGWIGLRTDAPLAWTLAYIHMMFPPVKRGSSVLTPYWLPQPRHLGYMEQRESEGESGDDAESFDTSEDSRSEEH